MTRDPNAESWGGIKRISCEVFSRVCGYLRPLTRWNDGKVSEFKKRKTFRFKSDKSES